MKLPTVQMARSTALALGAVPIERAHGRRVPMIQIVCEDISILWWPMERQLGRELMGG